MTKDQIMRMARESGMPDPMVFIGAYERFSALLEASAAAAEREACATVCDAASEPRRGYGQTDEQWAAATLAERIRARGNP